jgi:hypothetical protein
MSHVANFRWDVNRGCRHDWRRFGRRVAHQSSQLRAFVTPRRPDKAPSSHWMDIPLELAAPRQECQGIPSGGQERQAHDIDAASSSARRPITRVQIAIHDTFDIKQQLHLEPGLEPGLEKIIKKSMEARALVENQETATQAERSS